MSKGYGFVEFDTDKSASDAIENMNGFELCGRQLKVELSFLFEHPFCKENYNEICYLGWAFSSRRRVNLGTGCYAVAKHARHGGGVASNANGPSRFSEKPIDARCCRSPRGTRLKLAVIYHPLINHEILPPLVEVKSLEDGPAPDRFALMQKLAAGRAPPESRCVALRNMVGLDDVDASLEGVSPQWIGLTSLSYYFFAFEGGERRMFDFWRSGKNPC